MRNAEVIRQWRILRTLDAQRLGKTVDALALQLNVGKRTVWRDMVALQEAGFPLTSELDGRRTRWKLVAAPFRGLVRARSVDDGSLRVVHGAGDGRRHGRRAVWRGTRGGRPSD